MTSDALTARSEPAARAGARRPDLFIIGAAKCGTTSLYDYLAGHPQIFMSPDKEPQYFAPDLATELLGRTLRHPQDGERYLALFSAARDEKRLGEASVRYIFSPQAPGLIREFQPDARIVAMLRHPVDMMHSLHAHYVAGGIEQITDFEQALAAEEDRRQGRRVRPGMNRRLLLYSERARFGEQLRRWFEAFDRQQIHVILLEDLVADPAATFRRLLEFLEVDPDYRPPSFRVKNPGHQPRVRAVPSLTSSAPPRRLARRLLPQALRDEIRRRLIRPLRGLNRRTSSRAPLQPELRRRLEEQFAADVALASELVGRDLAASWGMRREDDSAGGDEPTLAA